MRSDKKKKPKKRKASINYQDVVNRSLNPLKETKQVKLFEVDED